MSYSDFTLTDLQGKCQLNLVEDQVLFPDSLSYELNPELNRLLTSFIPLALAIDTEKARSELIVAPLLAILKLELKNVSLFSGIEFTIDQALGLAGRCDFILARSPLQYQLKAPLLVIVEAKNDNIKSGIAQCGAEMVAAQHFNTKHLSDVVVVYGCITTGSLWHFLKLVDKNLYIDMDEYHVQPLQRIMGILSFILR